MDPRIEAARRRGERAAAGWTLAVPATAPSGLAGARPGRRSGASLDFREHREYRPGDDLRHLDWAASGRTDRLTVKVFHEEVVPHLDLVLDGSRSMALEGTPKGEATVAFAAFLARAAAQGGFTVAAWLAADGCRRLGRPGAASEGWERLVFESAVDLETALLERPPALRPRGLRVLVSDLLTAAEPRAVVRLLARDAAAVVVVQLLAQADEEPEAGGRRRLEDVETGEALDLLVDAAAALRYRAALARHRDAWRSACREVGATFATVVAEPLLADWGPASLGELVHSAVLVPS